MRVLCTTEGTYPHVLGGVSTWCDQLLSGLPQHEFDVLAVTAPTTGAPIYGRPANVRSLVSLPVWRPRKGLRRAGARDRTAFLEAFEGLLSCARTPESEVADGPSGPGASSRQSPGSRIKDIAFADGLYALAQLGSRVDLWPLFEDRGAWSLVGAALGRLLRRPATVGEISQAAHVLRATLVPVLLVPERVDLAQTIANGLAAVPAYAAARAHRVPLMLVEHGVYLRERYLGFAGESEPPGVKLLRARLYRALATLVYSRADLVVSVSEFNRRWQVELGASFERTRVIYNGVVPDAFPLADAGARPVPTVSWVGRVDPLKDLETLIRAFDRVRRSVQGAELRLYGPVPFGNEGYYRDLLRLVDRLDAASAVHFEGPVQPVYRAYHDADVVALSSVSEAFPYVPIEAMMCGRAVVATRVGGVPEAVAGVGRLVSPRAPSELADALAELLADARLRADLAERARTAALERFTMSRMTASYEDAYYNLGGGGAASEAMTTLAGDPPGPLHEVLAGEAAA
jgi:polysaccharide biosynthesis protein PelF